ncbi:TolC family protein [Parvibaculum lavamentivorans]|nr:TolC family protein [Parvibaculum lavamentivorans]
MYLFERPKTVAGQAASSFFLIPRIFPALVVSLLCLVLHSPTAEGQNLDIGPESVTWSLVDLVQTAVLSHPSVQAQRETLRASEADLRGAWWQYLPSPSIQGERVDGGNLVTMQLTQPLWSGGRLSSGVALAEARVEQSRWSEVQVQYQLADQVVTQYGLLMSAHVGIQIYEAYLHNLRDLERMMRRRVDQGYSAVVDAKLVASRVSQAMGVRTTLFASRASAVGILSQLVGRQIAANDVAEPANSLPNGRWQERRHVLVRMAIQTDPSLRAASVTVDVAKAQTEQAESSLMPNIFARIRRREALGGSSVDDETDFLIGFEFSLSGGWSSVEGVNASVAREAVARSSRQAQLTELTARVTTELEDYRSAAILIEELSINRNTQQEIFDSYTRMFLAGKRSWLDVLNVMREQLEVEKSLADARVRLATSNYRLKLSTGGASWRRD